MRIKSIIFVDRENELEVLEKAYSSNRAELVIIYGRRRIGKTFLLSFFARNRKTIYLIVNYSERELALKNLEEQLVKQVKLPYAPRIENFSDLYKILKHQNIRLIIIDEQNRRSNRITERVGPPPSQKQYHAGTRMLLSRHDGENRLILRIPPLR